MAFDFKRQIQRDLAQVTQTDLAQNVIFVPPVGAIGGPKTVKAYAGKHSITVTDLGFTTISTNRAYVTVMESVLKAAGYGTRNADGSLIDFTGHLVIITDVSDFTVTYIVQDGGLKADESFGSLTFTLGYYKTGAGGVPGPPRTIYGWKVYKLFMDIVASPDPLALQVIGNGDTIPLQYTLNLDGTLTMPYLISVPGIIVLTPFMLNNNPIANMPYNSVTGTFNAVPPTRGFAIGNRIAFNASLPIYALAP